MMIRRGTYLLTILAAGALLAGCGGAASTPTTGATGATGAPGDTSAAPTPDPNSQTVGNTTGGDAIDQANGTDGSGGSDGGALPALGDAENVSGFGASDNQLFAAGAKFTDITGGDTTSTISDGYTTETSPSVTSTSTSSTSVTTVSSAKVSVDDSIFTVAKGSILPKDTEQFEVTALTKDSITLTLTAGEFPDGSDGFSLKVGQSVKLVNQNEGTAYVLKLISTG